MWRLLIVLIIAITLGVAGCIKTGGAAPAADKAPRIKLFEVAPQKVQSGQPVTLSWEVSEASSITIQPGIGFVEPLGSKQVVVTANTTYILTAINRYGPTKKQLDVSIIALGGNTGDLPTLQGSGQSSSLGGFNPQPGSLTVPNGTPNSPNMAGFAPSGQSGNQPSGMGVLTPAQGGNQPAGSGMAGFKDALPGQGGNPPVIHRFDGYPDLIGLGMISLLTWEVDNAEEISIDNGSGDITNVSIWKRGLFVGPTKNHTYILTAKNSYGTSTAKTDVRVSTNTSEFDNSYKYPWLIAFEIYPEKVMKGQSVWICWHTNKCDKVTLKNNLGLYIPLSSYGELTVVPEASAVWTLGFESSEYPDAAAKGYGKYVEVIDKP
jgi:hypothetical protein